MHSLLLAVILAGAASAPKELRIVGRGEAGQRWSQAPTEVRRDQHPQLAVVGLGREGGHRVVFVDEAVEPLWLDGAAVPARERRPWGAVAVRWLQVEPHAWREKGRPAKNGVDTEFHSNVSMDPKHFGQWLGFDELTYFETELAPFSESAEGRALTPVLKPSLPADDVHGGLGTLRFKAELRTESGAVLATPGAEEVDTFGLRASVHRVTVRADDSFVGHLTGFFLVPEVFGSAGEGGNNQTDRYVGADCADVLVGALRAQGYRKLAYSNVAALPGLTTVVAKPVLFDPDHGPLVPIPGVKVGDVVRIDYAGNLQGSTPRSWDHVGVLYEDRSNPEGPFHGGPDGQLDGFDLLVHMGHPHLVVEPLSSQLPARIDVLRWDAKKLGPRS